MKQSSRRQEVDTEQKGRRLGRYGSSVTFTEINLNAESRNKGPDGPHGQRKQESSSAIKSVAKSSFSRPQKSKAPWKEEIQNASDSDFSDIIGGSSVNSLLSVRPPSEFDVAERKKLDVSGRSERVGRRKSLERDVDIASTLSRKGRVRTFKSEQERLMISQRRRKMRIAGTVGTEPLPQPRQTAVEENRRDVDSQMLDEFLNDDEEPELDFTDRRQPMPSFQTFAPPEAGVRKSENPFDSPRAAEVSAPPVHQLTIDRHGNVKVVDYDADLDFLIPPPIQQKRGGSTLMRTMKRIVNKKKQP